MISNNNFSTIEKITIGFGKHSAITFGEMLYNKKYHDYVDWMVREKFETKSLSMKIFIDEYKRIKNPIKQPENVIIDDVVKQGKIKKIKIEDIPVEEININNQYEFGINLFDMILKDSDMETHENFRSFSITQKHNNILKQTIFKNLKFLMYEYSSRRIEKIVKNNYDEVTSIQLSFSNPCEYRYYKIYTVQIKRLSNRTMIYKRQTKNQEGDDIIYFHDFGEKLTVTIDEKIRIELKMLLRNIQYYFDGDLLIEGLGSDVKIRNNDACNLCLEDFNKIYRKCCTNLCHDCYSKTIEKSHFKCFICKKYFKLQ